MTAFWLSALMQANTRLNKFNTLYFETRTHNKHNFKSMVSFRHFAPGGGGEGGERDDTSGMRNGAVTPRMDG